MNTDRRLLEDELIGHGDELMPRPFGAAPGGRSGRRESFTTLVPDSHPIECKTRDGSRGLIRDGEARTDIDLAQHVAVFA